MDHLPGSGPNREEVETAVVRFAGDSGDGVQLTGTQFTMATALAGNGLETFPDFPAEIRAPVGTTFGVSAFQINFGARRIYTVGDRTDVLVALNPAALKVNLRELKPDIFLGAHGSFFGLAEKREKLAAGNPYAFIDPPGYKAYLDRAQLQIEDTLAAQGVDRGCSSILPPTDEPVPRVRSIPKDRPGVAASPASPVPTPTPSS